MKQPLLERFIFWICDTFGHAKNGSRNAAWTHNGKIHYTCERCGRTVSKPNK